MTRTKIRQDIQIDNSRVYDDAYAGANTVGMAEPTFDASIEYDLNILRTNMKNIKGTADWYSANTHSVETIDGYVTALETFVGAAYGETAPNYSSTIVVAQSSPLETAIGAIDAYFAVFQPITTMQDTFDFSQSESEIDPEINIGALDFNISGTGNITIGGESQTIATSTKSAIFGGDANSLGAAAAAEVTEISFNYPFFFGNLNASGGAGWAVQLYDGTDAPHYFWFNISGGGTSSIDPGLIGTPHPVNILNTDDEATVAQALSTAIGAVSGFSSSVSGQVVTVTNTATGSATDATRHQGDTGYGGGGGSINIITQGNSALGGGQTSTIVGSLQSSILATDRATIVGGGFSTISGGSTWGVIVGTTSGQITAGEKSALIGGDSNTIAGSASAVLGGSSNSITGSTSTSVILGGYGNTISNERSAIVGGNDNTNSGIGSVILGGGNNQASGVWSTVLGGNGNNVTSNNSIILGGELNLASASYTAVSGYDNTASGNISAVLGGEGNTASGAKATVLGGNANTASGEGASIIGGNSNTASGFGNAVVGGGNNAASQNRSIVLGGLKNTATHDFSIAMGVGSLTSAVSDLVIGNNTDGSASSLSFNHFRLAGDTSDIHFGRHVNQSAVAGASNKLFFHTVEASNQSKYVSIHAPASGLTSYDLTLPAAQATGAGKLLTNDGAGVLAWGPGLDSVTLQFAYNNNINAEPDILLSTSKPFSIVASDGQPTMTISDAYFRVWDASDGSPSFEVTESKVTILGGAASGDPIVEVTADYFKVFTTGTPDGPTLMVNTTSGDGYVWIDGYLAITGSTLQVNTVVTDADHWLLTPASPTQPALIIAPESSGFDGYYIGVQDASGVDGYSFFVEEDSTLTRVGIVGNVELQYKDGTEGAGKYLMSDATGKAEWANFSALAGDGLSFAGGDFDVNVIAGQTKIASDAVGIADAFSKTDFTAFTMASASDMTLDAKGNTIVLKTDGYAASLDGYVLMATANGTGESAWEQLTASSIFVSDTFNSTPSSGSQTLQNVLTEMDAYMVDAYMQIDRTQGSLGAAINGSGAWVGFSGTALLDTSLTISDSLELLDDGYASLKAQMEVLGKVEKAVFVIASSDSRLSNAGKTLNISSADRGSVDLSSVSSSHKMERDVEVFVNGILQLADATSSNLATPATDDYHVASDNTARIVFSFALVEGDVVTVTNKKGNLSEDVDAGWTY